MLPQLAVGGWMPRPRKDSVDSKTIAAGIDNVARTSTGAMRLGMMWTNMIRHGLAPSDLAASMYSFSLIDRVWPRTMRAIAAHEKNEITEMTIVRLGPNTTASDSASTRYGKASTVSMNLASTASTKPPKNPLIRPTATPATVAIAVVVRPTNSDTRAP